jgi:biotin synthase-related radical SAM superfamily protein
MVIPCVVTACFELFSKMKTAYTLKEKILLASFTPSMGAAIESKKTDAVSVERKNSAWETITTHYNSQPESTMADKKF